MGRESRRMHRRDVAGMIDVIDTMTGETMGHLGNLSVGGMLLLGSVLLTEDALYQCHFVLPDSGDEAIEVGAHVLWLDRASAPGQSWAGVRFLGVDPDTTSRLRSWCQPKP
ncbi:MAG: PilZ domain-containing protein [Thermomonas sp.]